MASTETFIGRPALSKTIKPKLEGDRIISYSQYSKYFACPKSWELNYIHKHREPSESIDLVFGQAMHSTLQQWLKVLYTVTVKKAMEMDLNALLLAEMKREYLERKEKFGRDFTTPEELTSYYASGVEILKFLVRKRSRYFRTKKMELISIEFPLMEQIHEDYPTVKMMGYIDLIFYDAIMEKYIVMDIKTSNRGWKDYKKKDDLTTDQVLIYKLYMCQILKADIKDVDVMFFILKRNIDPDSLYPQKRIQEFSPSNGKVSLNRVSKKLKQFVEECFNFDGSYKTDRVYPQFAGRNSKNCMFCPYSDREDLCPSKNRITECG